MVNTLILLFGIAAFIPLINRVAGKQTGRVISLVSLGLLAYYIRLFVLTDGAGSTDSLQWMSTLGIHVDLRMDGLAFFFVVLILGVGSLIFSYADGYFDGHGPPSFYGILTLFMAAMLGLVLSDNVFIMFFFWELTSFTSYLLIGHYHEKEASRKAALQAFLITGAGGLCLLAGVILLVDAGGGVSFTALAANKVALVESPLLTPMLVLILLGAFTKSAQFPFHFWLPGAMAAPAPVSAFLHSATMVKAGIYLMARVHPLFGDQAIWTALVAPVGSATMVVCAWLAFRQTYLKKYLAYTTLSALGAVTLMLGLGNDKAVLAAVAFLAAHALYKSSLFMVAGAIQHCTGESDVEKLGGLASRMPLAAAACTLAAASMAGIPPFVGFIAKELLYEGTLNTAFGPVIYTAAVFFSNALIVATAIVIGYQPFWGRVPEGVTIKVHNGPVSLCGVPVIPAALGLAVGLLPGMLAAFFPGPVVMSIKPVAESPELHLWHGWSYPLMLDMGALVAGILLFKCRRYIHGFRLAPRTWLRGEGIFFSSLDAVLRFGKWQTGLLQNGHLRYYIRIIIGTLVLACGYLILSRGLGGMVSLRLTGVAFYDFALVALILLAAVSTITTRSRLAAVASLGVIGFCVALIFVVFSAPDLAMTQFAIETLMVLLLVLVLYHLPVFSTFTRFRTRVWDLVIAVSAGGLMAFLTLVATQYQYARPISEYFRQNSLAAHGKNIVNVILVDFRGFDTLGEITVLAVAALGVFALLKFTKGQNEKDPAP